MWSMESKKNMKHLKNVVVAQNARFGQSPAFTSVAISVRDEGCALMWSLKSKKNMTHFKNVVNPLD